MAVWILVSINGQALCGSVSRLTGSHGILTSELEPKHQKQTVYVYVTLLLLPLAQCKDQAAIFHTHSAACLHCLCFPGLVAAAHVSIIVTHHVQQLALDHSCTPVQEGWPKLFVAKYWLCRNCLKSPVLLATLQCSIHLPKCYAKATVTAAAASPTPQADNPAASRVHVQFSVSLQCLETPKSQATASTTHSCSWIVTAVL